MESYNCCFSDSDVSEGYIILNTPQPGQALYLHVCFKVEMKRNDLLVKKFAEVVQFMSANSEIWWLLLV